MESYANKISRFLIVDDSEKNRLFFEVLLNGLGYDEVYTASNGDEALVILETANIEFFLVAWELPGMSGTAFVQRLRSHRIRKFKPCMIYSKRMSKEEALLLTECGIENILTMPFEKEEASELICSMVEAEEQLDPVVRSLRRVRHLLDESSPIDALNRISRKHKKPGDFLYLTHSYIGEAYLQLAKYDKAEENLLKSIKFKGDFSESRRLLAQLYSKTNRHDKAISILQEMFTKSSENITTMLSLGSALVQADRCEEAREVFSKAKDLDPDSQELRDELGQLEFKEKNYSLAAQLLSETQHGDEIARNFNNMAIALTNSKMFDDAISTYINAMRVLPDKTKIHLLKYNLGLAFKKKGDNLKSFDAFVQSFMENPSFEKAYSALAKVYKSLGTDEKSLIKGVVVDVKKRRASHSKSPASAS